MSPKAKTVYRCTECGAEHPKWAGRCDGCGEWLGTPFVRAEESHRPVHGAKPRLQLQAS